MLFLLLALSHPFQPARAEPIPALSEYFSQKLTQLETRMSALPYGQDANQAWQLENVTIALAPTVTYGVPRVLNFSIAPEFEFVLVPEQNLARKP